MQPAGATGPGDRSYNPAALGGVMKTQQDMAANDHGFAVNLMQHLVVPTFVLDAECRVIIWNKACERLTGVAARDMIGTRDHWRAFYREQRPCLADLVAQGRTDEIERLYASWDKTEIAAFGIHAENWCVMPAVGSELYLAIDVGPIFSEDGALLAVVETLRDMTEQKRAQAALERLAARDGLTGVANRRSFDERLPVEWRRAARDHAPLSLLMIDVDHFKRFNDTYGHLRGDDCLQRVAGAIDGVVFRPGDLVARYGGEEFAVILPSTGLDGALIVADRILAGVRHLGIEHAGSEFGRVSLSIGAAACVPAEPGNGTPLVDAADRALYRAKREGRGRVVADSAEAGD